MEKLLWKSANIEPEEKHMENKYHTADLPVEEPSIEVRKAVKKLKNSKAPGSDDIPSELLKYGTESFYRQLHQLINLI